MKSRACGAGAGQGLGPHGTAELQVGEDLPAGDVADEEAEVFRVLEAGGRVVQKCPGGLVQRRAERAPSLSPPRGASGQDQGPSPGEPAAPGAGAGQGSAKGRGRSAGPGGGEAGGRGSDSGTTVPMYPGDTGDRVTGSRGCHRYRGSEFPGWPGPEVTSGRRGIGDRGSGCGPAPDTPAAQPGAAAR